MKVLIFSDIHNDLAALRRLVEVQADYYVCAGDLVSWAKRLDRCGEILQGKGDRVWVIPGNHESAEQIAAFCAKFGLRNFHEQLFEEQGRKFGGLGYSNPTPFDTPGEYTEDQLKQRLEKFAGIDGLVMICHAPPLETALDRIRDGVHAGSRSMREFIEANQPDYFFCGHIHEAEGRKVQLGNTVAVNAGKRGYLLEI